MEAITTAVGSIFEIVESVLTAITGNPILTVFFALPLLSVGIRFLRKLKH